MIPKGRGIGGPGGLNSFGGLQRNCPASKPAMTTPAYLLKVVPLEAARLKESDFQLIGPDAIAGYSDDVLNAVINHGIIKMRDDAIAAIPLTYVPKIRPIDLTYKVVHAFTLPQTKVLTQAQISSLDEFTLRDLDFEKKIILTGKGGMTADQAEAMLGPNTNETIAQIRRIQKARNEIL